MTSGMMYTMPYQEARRNLRHSNQKGSPTKPPSWVTLFIRKSWRPRSLSKKPKKTAKKVIRELNVNKKSNHNQNSSRSSSTCQGYFAVRCCSLPHAVWWRRVHDETWEKWTHLCTWKETGVWGLFLSSPSWFSLPDRHHGYCSQDTPCWSALLTKFTEMTDIYHTYGCCDYIFDIYDDTHQ